MVDTYQPLPTCNPASPCSGSVAVFPILTGSQAGALKPAQPANTLGTPVVNTSISASYWPLLLTGAAPACLRPHRRHNRGHRRLRLRHRIRFETKPGYIFGFTTGSDGTLTAIPGFPVPVGTQPSAIVSDSTGSYLYVTDAIQNLVYGFRSTEVSCPKSQVARFRPAVKPSAIVLDATGKFAIVANAQDSNLTVYTDRVRERSRG